MTAVSTIKHHGTHEVFDLMSKSSISALKVSFFMIESLVGLAILISVVLFIIVSFGFLFNAILF